MPAAQQAKRQDQRHHAGLSKAEHVRISCSFSAVNGFTRAVDCTARRILSCSGGPFDDGEFYDETTNFFFRAMLPSWPTAFAQTTGQKPFEPQVGRPARTWVVPTPQAVVDKMLDMAKVTKTDFVMDLGSGDGRTVITAAKRGARAMGIEYNPDMVDLSVRNAKEAGVADRATFVKADLFETDLSKADVITMFLLPSINMKLRPKILDLKPGTRIVSNTFTMEDWQAIDDDGDRRLLPAVHTARTDWPAKVAEL